MAAPIETTRIESRAKRILVDSNILLLLVIGRIERRSIAAFKRTAQFEEEDFDRLVRILGRFDQIVTTPCVLAEVNSLLSQFKLRPRAEVMTVFAGVIGVLDERYVEGVRASQTDVFSRLGLTDAGLRILAGEKTVVLTDDFMLRDALLRLGLAAVNFNELRTWA